jgi:hypothetical protein
MKGDIVIKMPAKLSWNLSRSKRSSCKGCFPGAEFVLESQPFGHQSAAKQKHFSCFLGFMKRQSLGV